MKRIFSIITSLIILLTIVTPISAVNNDNSLDNTPIDSCSQFHGR